MDFYLWGKLKQVYSEMSITREDIKEHIRKACVAIDPNEIRHVVLSESTFHKMRRCSGSSF